jgi:hypothetical protein
MALSSPCRCRILLALLSIVAPTQSSAASPPSADPNSQVLFVRHVVPVLSRLSCNAGGACHGTVQGQNGFRLSLFGGQPLLDFERLTREDLGRRISVLKPDQSLILVKATGQVPHGGGKRLEVGSSDYRILRSWIAGGASLDNIAKSEVTQLVVAPANVVLKPGEARQLRVTARYRDGSNADVTALCRFEAQDTNIVNAAGSGQVDGMQVGDTAVLIRYGAEPITATVLVAPGGPQELSGAIKPANFIDEHILTKLRTLHIEPAGICDDATFLRRLYLDVTGYLPSPADMRAFVKDKDPEKRNKKIDDVLTKAGYAEIWAAKFCDLIKPRSARDYGAWLDQARFYEWVRARLSENAPYDQLVERMVVSDTLDNRSPEQWIADMDPDEPSKKSTLGWGPAPAAYARRRTLDLYWLRRGAGEIIGTVQFAHAFLGLRLQCAQCHRHPYDVWQQDDLLSFANFFMAMNVVREQGAREDQPPRHSPAVEAYLKGIQTELEMWQKDLKRLQPSKDPAEQLKLQHLTAKIGAIEYLRRFEISPVTHEKIPFAAVANTLGRQQSAVLRLLGEKKDLEIRPGRDRRLLVMEWLRRPDNPFFARAIVNRVWAHYMGRGIIDPPDHLSPLNPPSHPKLLDDLCRGFIQSGYDLKWLHRTILRSRTYQQGHEANVSNRHDRRNYSRHYVRRLPGEVILDVLRQATGSARVEARHGGVTGRDVALAGMAVDGYGYGDNYPYLVFGRQPREVSVQCDCEQSNEVTVAQLLFLANHPLVRQRIAAENGLAAALARNKQMNNSDKIEELFLAALGRFPSAAEVRAGLEHLESSLSQRKGLEEVLWSLLNCRGFLLNY